MVLMRPGNPTRGDPGKGRRRQVAEPLEGDMAGASKPDPMSTQHQRIAELALLRQRVRDKRSESVTLTSRMP